MAFGKVIKSTKKVFFYKHEQVQYAVHQGRQRTQKYMINSQI